MSVYLAFGEVLLESLANREREHYLKNALEEENSVFHLVRHSYHRVAPQLTCGNSRLLSVKQFFFAGVIGRRDVSVISVRVCSLSRGYPALYARP